MSEPLAQCTGLTRVFGRFRAVDDVGLRLRPGEVVGLLGANGAGKTTLIRMLLGLLRPTSGEVLLFGEPPSRRTRSRIGYVPQSLGLYDDLTLAENLAFSAAVFGAAGAGPGLGAGAGPETGPGRGGGAGLETGAGPGTGAAPEPGPGPGLEGDTGLEAGAGAWPQTGAGAETGARAGHGARRRGAPELPANLRPFSGTVTGSLPLGIQRGAAFAQALAHRPELLILDEPTSGVDPLSRARLWETVAEAAATGTGVLVTTHYMDEAGECDRLVVMAGGRVVAEGGAAEIIGTAQVTVVRAADWAEAFGALDAAGLPAALSGRTLRVPGASPRAVREALGQAQAEVSQEPATLEERFFQLTLDAGDRVRAGAGTPGADGALP